MVFGLFTLFVALIISAVAAYYSIVGLTAIFSAAVIPIIIMGAALEIGKVTAAVWLKLNWERAKWTYKLYLVPAVAFLMLLTSMGIFGFLSKAHSDQTLVSGDVQSKIAIYDEKIKTAKENIEADRRQLRQMDEAVDQVMARSTTEEGATKSNAIRRAQARDRAALAKSIEANQKLIGVLNDEAAPIRAEIRKVEAEVGPIKYVAALIYGDNPEENLLERAVRWVIILIVAVFDPLALVLILAAQQSIRWAREEKDQEQNKPDAWVADVGEKPTEEEKISEEEFRRELENDPELSAFFERSREVARALDRGEPIPGSTVAEQDEQHDVSVEKNIENTPSTPPAEVVEHRPETHPYLNQGFKYPEGWVHVGPMVAPTEESNSRQETEEKSADDIENTSIPLTKRFYKILNDDYLEVEGKTIHKRVLADLYPDIHADLEAKKQQLKDLQPGESTFGIEFPDTPTKGQVFLNIKTLPSKLYKFNGSQWIEVDKSIADSYTYNNEYLEYLVEKIKLGHISIDDLTIKEQEQVEEYLNNVKSNNNAAGPSAD